MKMALDLTDLQAQQEQFGIIETHEVHSIDDVDNAFKEIRELQTQRDGITTRADKQIKTVTDWRDASYHSIDSRVDFLQREIMAVYLNDDMSGKLSSPWGSATVRHTAASPDWTDEKAALKHFEDNGDDDLITTKTTKSINKAKAKKALTLAGDVYVDEDGQPVPGIGVKPATATASFKSEVED